MNDNERQFVSIVREHPEIADVLVELIKLMLDGNEEMSRNGFLSEEYKARARAHYDERYLEDKREQLYEDMIDSIERGDVH